MALTYIEMKHLQDYASKYGIDLYEIDDSITYYENKAHLEDLGKRLSMGEQISDEEAERLTLVELEKEAAELGRRVVTPREHDELLDLKRMQEQVREKIRKLTEREKLLSLLKVLPQSEWKEHEHELRSLKWTLRARKGQIVGFYKDREGKNRPITRSVADLTRKKMIKSGRQFKAVTPKPKPHKLRLPKLPKPKLPKRRKRLHVERNGKTMRALKNVTGVKVFSFGDSIWKVKKRKQKR